MAQECACGLTSREAQGRLHREILDFSFQAMKISWAKEVLLRPPFIVFSSLFTIIVALLLLFDYVYGEQGGTSLFQAIFLVVLTTVNITLFACEVYILRTRRIRRLLSRITPLLGSQCPWGPHSYPTRSISTLRGNLTVHTYRDSLLINLPSSLLVRGDVIQLHKGMAAPANVTLMKNEDSKENGEAVQVQIGEFPPNELFMSAESAIKHEAVEFVPEAKTIKFRVAETPIISLLASTVNKRRAKTFLTHERNIGIIALSILALVLVPITCTVNIIRWLVFHDTLHSESLTEVWLLTPAYTILPVLHCPLYVVWTLINLYGTARIVALVEGGPNALKHPTGKYFTILKIMRDLLLHSSSYPNYRVFHILGSLTSFCSVDMEYVLAGGYPTPEKVFFLRSTEAVNGDAGSGDDPEREEEKEGTPANSSSAEKVDNESIPYRVTVDQSEFRESRNEQERLCVKTVESKLEIASVVSTISRFEVVTEFLDISPNLDTPSGLAFDEVGWEQHIGSLKPIGVNALASSHLLNDPYTWCPLGSSEDLRQYIRNTNCLCPLGVEIGVTEYSQVNFEREVLVYSVGGRQVPTNTITRKTSAVFLNSVQNTQSHMISVVLVNRGNAGHRLVMSRGSGDMVAVCCSDFWDGRDLQPMTDVEQLAIMEFFNRRSLTSYCVALAYNPLLEGGGLGLQRKQNVSLFISDAHLRGNVNDLTVTGSMDDTSSTQTHAHCTAEQMFNDVQCNQVFLGMVSLQFRPHSDVVTLIEDLDNAGIRFVHFTTESEVRGRIFAEKLGLEAGWNCHISLGAPSEESSEASGDTESRELAGSTGTSPSSSLNSVIHAYQSYIRAKLPKGIQNVRPHIKNRDNVPLLVPLFTDCTTDTIREMFEVMQENGEVVLCLGNAWNRDNLTLFAQADISLSVVPENVEQPKCPGIGAVSLQSSISDHPSSNLRRELEWPSPLEMASHINSTTCQLSFGRDADVSILSLVTESRHILSCGRHCLLFGLGCLLSLSLLFVLSSIVMLLPSPLSGSHLFWFLFFVVPALSLSLLSSPADPTVNSQMPNRKEHVWDGKWLLLLQFVLLFIPTVIVCLVLFVFTLRGICDCNPLSGPNSDQSVWHGWRDEYEQGLWFAQDFTALFLNVYMVALYVRFIHRTQPIWCLWRYVSWQNMVLATGAVIVQIVHFAVSQVFATELYDFDKVADLSHVPSYVWVVGLIWPFLLVTFEEFLKYYDRKRVRRSQRHLRLEFETKLGMNSPF